MARVQLAAIRLRTPTRVRLFRKASARLCPDRSHLPGFLARRGQGSRGHWSKQARVGAALATEPRSSAGSEEPPLS